MSSPDLRHGQRRESVGQAAKPGHRAISGLDRFGEHLFRASPESLLTVESAVHDQALARLAVFSDAEYLVLAVLVVEIPAGLDHHDRHPTAASMPAGAGPSRDGPGSEQ